MKKYFQKLYNETGKKPFTFLNCFLCIFLPIVAVILGAVINSQDPGPAIVLLIVSVIGGLVGNTLIQFNRFKDVKRAILLTLLNMLASIHFFFKLIVFPFMSWAMKMAAGMTSAQMGNTRMATSQMNNATSSTGVKLSALNWFVYDNRVYTDIEGTETPIEYENNNAYDTSLGRSYTDKEDMNARSMGYRDAKHAVDSGVRVEDLNK